MARQSQSIELYGTLDKMKVRQLAGSLPRLTKSGIKAMQCRVNFLLFTLSSTLLTLSFEL